jgi:hypothetical protein
VSWLVLGDRSRLLGAVDTLRPGERQKYGVGRAVAAVHMRRAESGHRAALPLLVHRGTDVEVTSVVREPWPSSTLSAGGDAAKIARSGGPGARSELSWFASER